MSFVLLNKEKDAFLNDIRESFLTEINRIRADPLSLLPVITDIIENRIVIQDEKTYFQSQNRDQLIEQKEGLRGLENVILLLKNQRPVETLIFSEEISKAAQEKITSFSEKFSAEELSNGLDKYVEWEEYCSEAFVIGVKTGKDALLQMLIDDNSFVKAYQRLLFFEKIKYVGIGVSLNNDYGVVISAVFVGNIRPLNTRYFNKDTYKYQYPGLSKGLMFDEPFSFDDNKNNVTTIMTTENYDPKKTQDKKQSFITDDDAPVNCVSFSSKKHMVLDNEKCVYQKIKKHYELKSRLPQQRSHIIEIESVL